MHFFKVSLSRKQIMSFLSPCLTYPSVNRLGDDNVLAVIGDSTNATAEGTSGSESLVKESLTDIMSRLKTQSIAVGCFSSNIARMESIVYAARKNGRKVRGREREREGEKRAINFFAFVEFGQKKTKTTKKTH